MDVEEIREGVLAILKELHEDIDFEAEDKMVEDKILDSFDLVTLVTELGEEFDVDITAKDFIACRYDCSPVRRISCGGRKVAFCLFHTSLSCFCWYCLRYIMSFLSGFSGSYY